MAYYQSTDGMVYDFAHEPSGKDWVKLSAAKGKEGQRNQSREQLRNVFDAMAPEDRRVYCVLRNVSASGMSRRIDFYIIEDNRPRYLSGLMAYALDYKLSDKGGLVVGGCGMDMGFHVVYSLASVLYKGDGYAIKSEWI